ncbi:hypothetical protein AgCh_011840 [Apium graveolens]
MYYMYGQHSTDNDIYPRKNKDINSLPPRSGVKSQSVRANRKNILVLDSGCSGHMTGNKDLLSDFVEKAGPGVSYEDDNMGKTPGYGNIDKWHFIPLRTSYNSLN